MSYASIILGLGTAVSAAIVLRTVHHASEEHTKKLKHGINKDFTAREEEMGYRLILKDLGSQNSPIYKLLSYS